MYYHARSTKITFSVAAGKQPGEETSSECTNVFMVWGIIIFCYNTPKHDTLKNNGTSDA